jgi:DNA-binding XRE family transcriptional regulator
MKGYAEPVETRLWKSYEPEPNTGCWLWCLTLNRDGYGLVNTLRKTRQAHRVAYELAIGPIPDGKCVLHRCDVPPCINPSHLFLGTNAVNMADRDRKQRQARYERQWKAKLTQEAVRDIRARYDEGETQEDLAQEYGVWPTTIGYVVNGHTWKGIEVPRRTIEVA